MAYLDQDGYVKRFGAEELEQVLATDDSITLAVAIADAESIVNGYLAAVPDRAYVVPLPLAVPTPARITELTADLARYEIHAKKVTHEIKRRRDQAIAFLENMVKGLVAIPELLPGGGQIPDNEGGIDVTAAPRVFDTCSLRGYVGP